jgi:hypothetical protein
MWKDPIVEEVRKVRLKIEAECDGDSSKILARAMALQNEFQSRLVSKSSRRVKRSDNKARRKAVYQAQ